MSNLLNNDWFDAIWILFVFGIMLLGWIIANSKDWLSDIRERASANSQSQKEKPKKQKICWVCYKYFPKNEKFKWVDFNYGNDVVDTKNQRCCLNCYNKIEDIKNTAIFKKTNNIDDLKHVCNLCIREDHIVKQATKQLGGNYKIKTGELVFGEWNVCDDCYNKYKPGKNGIIPNRPNFKQTMNLFGILIK